MKVTLGVCGGIAAYKSAELVRSLQQHALDVHVVMTQAATEFIRPLTFAALTGHKVITSLWDATASADAEASPVTAPVSAIDHIAEAQTSDVLVVAPATADTLAKFTHGLADDFLSTLYLATAAPVIVAPAMNVNMWDHPATRANLETLAARGVRIVAPETGELACGMVGAGRLAELSRIVDAVLASLNRHHDLAQETVIVTAGGTREAIDPVRFLGNRSSGRMGYSLAEAAERRGAKVILISGPSSLQAPARCEFIPVTTAAEMRAAVLHRLPEATMVIKSAAVADYRARVVAESKLKRSGPISLELEPTEDILREVSEQRVPGTLVIGFAAETENALEQGRSKLERKGVDAIVINDVSRREVGFDSDRNAATFLTRQTAIDLPEMTKREMADRILDEAMELRRPRQMMVEFTMPSRNAIRIEE
jgi:phosphopantothenoylcysteine decarboxylase/phosphopantothenate--cysteine ligase